MDASYYADLVRPHVEGRRWIVTGEVLAGMTSIVRNLRGLGSERLFLLADSYGTGDLPDPQDAEWIVNDHSSADMIEGIHRMRALIEDPPQDLVRRIDEYDPDGSALVNGGFAAIPKFAGRRMIGWRRPAWEALEDKVLCDELWDAAGVARAPYRIVAARQDDLRAAARELDRGAGTVWSGDAREGFNGGAVFVRWVKEDDEAREAESFLGSRCDRARVMPFLDGIPCSIHGVVFADVVIAFRPVELVTLRQPSAPLLRYAGCATYWDPRDADREAMRDVARRVGTLLRERVDYRGPFTVDGVMTAEGFRPTELNPRAGAGFGPLLAGLPGLPFGLLCRLVIEDEPLDWRPIELERLVLDAADSTRGGGGWTVVDTPHDKTTTRRLMRTADGYRLADESDAGSATLLVGPSAVGGFVRFSPDEGSIATGRSIAPYVAEAFTLANEELGAGIGPVSPAPSVR